MSGLFSGLDPRSATPLYVQLAESVRRAIAAGELAPGDTLPSVRALATKLRVNPAAITHAYRELERDGIAETEKGGSLGTTRIVRTLPQPTAPRSRPSGPFRADLAPALSNLEVGHTIDDRFVVKRRIGAGAMGAVYLAHDRELDEEVALKVLPPLTNDDETAVRRFLNEIRVARRISHRNVVRTHDVGRWSGGLFLTMEYVAGRTLREELDSRHVLPAVEVSALGIQLCEALAVAHQEGIIHRDIKPQNLLLDKASQLKVLDFGIAVVLGTSGQLTEAGLLVGTPAYMAPEQLLGEALGPSADLYAVGVVFYECLCGVLPYEAASPMALVAQIVQHRPKPLLERAPAADPQLAALVSRLLEHEPSRRPTAAETVSTLRLRV